jgi:pimeloyl-ACP methyl ester carboxylesterase
MAKISVNGIELNYSDTGKGNAIVLLHNVVSNITALQQNIAVLSKTFRVIACDLRGHGLTSHCDDELTARAFYTFENISLDISELLNRLEVDRFSIVGQAYWGVSSAAHLFDLLPQRVDGMVFASCDLLARPDDDAEPYSGLDEKAIRNFERMISLAKTFGMQAVYEERLKSNTFWGPTVLNSPKLLEVFKKLHDETSPVAFANFPRFKQSTLNRIVSKLKENKTPLMMLLGAEDSHNDLMMKNMRSLYPPTHIALLPYCGHYLTIENPFDFNCAVYNFVCGALRK